MQRAAMQGYGVAESSLTLFLSTPIIIDAAETKLSTTFACFLVLNYPICFLVLN